MKRTIMMLVVLLVGSVGIAAPVEASPKKTVKIFVELSEDVRFYGDSQAEAQDLCSRGVVGVDYAGVAVGDQVTAQDASGRIIGLGSLNKASVTFKSTGKGLSGDKTISYWKCVLIGSVKVTKSSFYDFKIDDKPTPSYSYADLAKNKWTLRLTL